jgi:hypothetical protein
MFNTTFNNISIISWHPVTSVEETRVPEENHRDILKSSAGLKLKYNPS